MIAAKAEASLRYLTSERAVSIWTRAGGPSPVPEVNVVAVGLGEKISDDAPTGVLSIKLFVRRKYPKEHISPDHLLPAEINGQPVDVDEIGEVRPLVAMPNPRLEITPAQPGCSIGFANAAGAPTMAGTFGALVKAQNGALFLLSNNHVLADESRLPLGAPIFQTGLLDLPPDGARRQIAQLVKFSALDAQPLHIDAALAAPSSPDAVKRDILFIGAPAGVAAAQIDMVVHKFGRTTGYTAGRVTSVSTDITVDYETGSFTFVDQILITGLDGSAFSDNGDSGSLVLERGTNRAIGLLFAGSPSLTVANHIGDVLTAFAVTLA
jgi:hypothetical protein